MCRKQPGIAIGMVCETCDGRCVLCDSFVNQKVVVHICDECNYGANSGKCIVCNRMGMSEAYYCRECVQLEKDRDGCAKVINVGVGRTDAYFEKKKFKGGAS